MDGFDHYGTGYVGSRISKKWGAVGSTPQVLASGRNSTNALFTDNAGEYLTMSIDDYSTLILGFAFYPSAQLENTASPIVSFLDTVSYYQVNVYTWGDRTIMLRTGGTSSSTGTLLGYTDICLIAQAWNYLEFKVTFHDTSGIVEVRHNGVEVFNQTSLDTSATGNAYSNGIRFGRATDPPSYFDDLYLCDDSGTLNNDFLGDCKVETLLPDGAGNYSQWTPTGEASNYLTVDDTTPDDDSTYVSVSGTNLKDTYTMDNLQTAVGTIYGVQSNIYARKDDAGTLGIQPLFRISSTDYTISGENLSDSYNYLTKIREKSPATDTAWTITEVNSLEFGFNKDV